MVSSPPNDRLASILVTGGARSGKSTFAERLAAQARSHAGAAVAASPTSPPPRPTTRDGGPRGRAPRRAARAWTTVECPLEVAAAVREHAAATATASSCSTASPSGSANLMFAAGDLGGTDARGAGQLRQGLLAARGRRSAPPARVAAASTTCSPPCAETGATLVAVSNEVGLGVVPEYPHGAPLPRRARPRQPAPGRRRRRASTCSSPASPSTSRRSPPTRSPRPAAGARRVPRPRRIEEEHEP